MDGYVLETRKGIGMVGFNMTCYRSQCIAVLASVVIGECGSTGKATAFQLRDVVLVMVTDASRLEGSP